MPVPKLPSEPTDSNSSATTDVTPVVALKELVARLHREQNKIQDLLSSLGFALRSFNNLNQFLELIPLMATRVTDADGSALFLYKPNGQVRLEQLHWQDSRQRKNIRKALETVSSQITHQQNVSGLATTTSILDAQMHYHLGPDVQIFGTAILVK
ncbi:guanylate cyclase, partial [Fischerella thermalis WC542]